jgi:carbon-monoxide dehydrogenase medium subunit
VAAALDATVTAAGPNGRREIAFADFPAAFMTPAIEPNELLTAVRFPVWPKGHGFAFIEFARRHGDFAIVSAAALLVEDGAGKIHRASVIIGGMGTVPIRAVELEQALIGRVPDDKLLQEACETCRKLEAIDDVHAPASYRQHLAAVLSRRALQQARARLPSRAAAPAH